MSEEKGKYVYLTSKAVVEVQSNLSVGGGTTEKKSEKKER